MDAAQAKIFEQELQGTTVGGWRVKEYLGSGKSAIVFQAVKNEQKAAIKIFHRELILRFGREAQLQRVIRELSLVGHNHMHLVKIFDAGECTETGLLFVVMEHLPFKNLHTVISNIPTDKIPKLIKQIASAAKFLEDKRLAHRDIKPENIVISDDFDNAILLDLGVLRPIGQSDLTDVDFRPFIGTLRYSSPEFLMREELDTVDGWKALTFYQIGAVLHDMLMRKSIFDEHSEPFAKLVDAVKSIIPIIVGEPIECVRLAKACLVKDPKKRLELVDWSDFNNLESEQTSHTEKLKDKISKIQEIAKARYLAEDTMESAQKMQVNGILEKLTFQVQQRLSAIIKNSEIYPLSQTSVEKDTKNKKCLFSINFEKSIEKGLPHAMSVQFEITIFQIDTDDYAYSATSNAFLLLHGTSICREYPKAKFYSGDLEELLNTKIENVIIMYVNAAYEALDSGAFPTVDSPLMLNLQTGV